MPGDKAVSGHDILARYTFDFKRQDDFGFIDAFRILILLAEADEKQRTSSGLARSRPMIIVQY
jgi:hypothetical protein